MHRRDLRVCLRNLQEEYRYPLSAIRDKTLSVDASSLKMLQVEDDMTERSFLKQTARKSTHSKLNEVKTESYCTPTVVDDLQQFPLSDTNEMSKEKETTVLAIEKPNKTFEIENGKKTSKLKNDDGQPNSTPVFTKSSMVLTGSKSRIATNKSDFFDETCAVVSTNNDINDETKLSSLQSKKTKTTSLWNSSGDWEMKENDSNEISSTSNKPPIKLLVSTVNGNPSLHSCTISNQPTSKSYSKDYFSKKIDSNPSEDTNDCFKSEPKVSPLKIIQNGKYEVKTVITSKKTASKLSIEKVVENLNMKQAKPTEVSPTLKKPDLKRSSSTNLSDEATCKKPRCSIDELKKEISTNNDSCVVTNGNHNAWKEANECKTEELTKEDVILTHKCPKWEDLSPEWEKFVKQLVKKEKSGLELKLKKQTEEYAKMKEKCESVERNFQSWIEFANKLQARVKKIAFALHKQQDSVKTLQVKKLQTEVEEKNTVSMGVQTDPEKPQDLTKTMVVKPSSLPTVQNKAVESKLDTIVNPNTKKVNHYNRSNSASSITKPGATLSLQAPLVMPKKLPNDVIDLTDDGESDDKKVPKKLSANSRKGQDNLQSAIARILTTRPGPLHPPPYATGAPTFVTSSAVYKRSTYPVDKKMLPVSSQPISSTQVAQNTKQGYRVSDTSSISSSVRPKSLSTQQNLPQQRMSSTSYPPLPMATAPPCTIRLPVGAPGPPPELMLAIKKNNGGIVLSWTNLVTIPHAEVMGYELFAYQDNPLATNKNWRRIGNESIGAMDLPMACTLTQFTSGCTYYFAVRGKDVYGRYGPFSKPCSNANL